MNSELIPITHKLISAARKKFNGNYTKVPEVRFYWHNIVFLLFSTINYKRLFKEQKTDYKKMVDLGIMPEYLFKLYEQDKSILENTIIDAAEEYYASPIKIEECRQEMLNIEMDFSDGNLEMFTDKVSRDNTGAYYTPRNLAMETIQKSFGSQFDNEKSNYKIMDFSCGSGEFYLALIDYLKNDWGIDPKVAAKWFYGVDVDPIALQICIVNILMEAEKQDWDEIVSHFTLGNPLIVANTEASDEEKNKLFAIGRIYSSGLGLPEEYFEERYDAVVGNPPWEKIRFEERKFFRGVVNSISSISQKNARDVEVEKLRDTWPEVYAWRKNVYEDYSMMTSTKYWHCKITESIAGELNTCALFTELAFNMLAENGFLALIVKSTIFTAPANKQLWCHFLSNNSVQGVYLYENRNKIFNIDSRERFAVFIASRQKIEEFEFSAGLISAEMIRTTSPVLLSAEDLVIINPITGMIPNVSNNNEIEFLKESHKRFAVFSEEYPNCHFGRLIHLTAHSAMIDKEKKPNNIPIYEGKFIERYDARYATFRGLPDNRKYANKASAQVMEVAENGKKEMPESRFFVQQELWDRFLVQYDQKYSLCWRSLTSTSNKRTMLAMILPTCPTCQSIQMLQTENNEELVLLLALFNSIPFDYFVRIKMPGLDLTQSVIKQIPVPSEHDYSATIDYYGVESTIKQHILSYTISLLIEEPMLSDFTESFAGRVYEINNVSKVEKEKRIDHLFAMAYHLDNKTYEQIITTFPKYLADRTF